MKKAQKGLLLLLVLQAALTTAGAGLWQAELWRPEEEDVPKILIFPERELGAPHKASAVARGHASTAQGSRQYQEDTYILRGIPALAGQGLLLAGVFDGHGGPQCSAFLRDRMAHVLGSTATRERGADWAAHLRQAIVALDEAFVRVPGSQHVGSTAAVAVVEHKKTLWTANVGDSRIVLVRRGGEAVPLTTDHKPDSPRERARIEATPGGFVRHLGVWRTQGILAMSRAVGDYALRPQVVCDPDVSRRDIDLDRDRFLVLASDGLFDVMSNEELGRQVDSWKGELRELPDHLVQEALRRGSTDNVTVLVVPL